MKKVITITLETYLVEQLEAISVATRRTRSDLVQEAIAALVSQYREMGVTDEVRV